MWVRALLIVSVAALSTGFSPPAAATEPEVDLVVGGGAQVQAWMDSPTTSTPGGGGHFVVGFGLRTDHIEWGLLSRWKFSVAVLSDGHAPQPVLERHASLRLTGGRADGPIRIGGQWGIGALAVPAVQSPPIGAIETGPVVLVGTGRMRLSVAWTVRHALSRGALLGFGFSIGFEALAPLSRRRL